MTILVGIRCKDGIVVGTDSAATFGVNPQIRTIEQPGIKKIVIVDERVIVAGTGEIGLGQRFCNIVQTAHTNKLFQKDPIEVARQLTISAVNDFASTKVTMGSYGALVAFPSTHGGSELCEFAASNFQPELKRDIWYVSMGSGQPIGDACLGFIRQVFWADGSPPSIEDGVFAVVWTLAQAIKLNPGGINAPMQIATLEGVGSKARARLLSDDELLEHQANVDGAIAHLRQYGKKVQA
jgi:20S proteasome alpha/beta subunit